MQFKVIIIFAICLGCAAPSHSNIIEKKGELLKAAIGVKMAGANLALKGVEVALEKKKMIVDAIQNSPHIKESISEKKKIIASIVKDVAEFKGNLLSKAITLGKTAALSALDIKKKIIEMKLQSNKPEMKPCDDKDKVPTTTPAHNSHTNCGKPKSVDIYEVERGIIVEAPMVYRLSPPAAIYGVQEVEFI